MAEVSNQEVTEERKRVVSILETQRVTYHDHYLYYYDQHRFDLANLAKAAETALEEAILAIVSTVGELPMYGLKEVRSDGSVET